MNVGKAVAVNAHWRDCNNAVAHAKTCGELPQKAELGEFVAFGNGEIGSPISFAGGQTTPGCLDAEAYNSMW